MRRLHQLQAPTHACVSPLGRWPELRREMATVRARYRSTFRFGVPYRKSAATKHVPAAAEKNIRTAAAAWPNGSGRTVLPCHSERSRGISDYFRISRDVSTSLDTTT